MLLRNKQSLLTIDVGKAPDKNSQEIIKLDYFLLNLNFLEKVITNSGYFQDYKHQLNIISKSSATHSTLVLDDTSTVRFERDKYGHMLANKNFKIINKEIRSNKNFWLVKASHDAFSKSNGVIHERQLNYFHDNYKLEGLTNLLRQKILNPVILQ